MLKPLDVHFTQHSTQMLQRDPDNTWMNDGEIDMSRATDSLFIPKGTTEQRRYVESDGQVRYNTDLGVYEAMSDGEWISFATYATHTGSKTFFAVPAGSVVRWQAAGRVPS